MVACRGRGKSLCKGLSVFWVIVSQSWLLTMAVLWRAVPGSAVLCPASSAGVAWLAELHGMPGRCPGVQDVCPSDHVL
jgi:hypothetical protein